MKTPQRLLEQNSLYIDPLECGSVVSYRVMDSGWDGDSYSCTVQLTDCSRMITWEFSANESGLDKMDAVLEIFSAAKKALRVAKKEQDKKLEKEKKIKEEKAKNK